MKYSRVHDAHIVHDNSDLKIEWNDIFISVTPGNNIPLVVTEMRSRTTKKKKIKISRDELRLSWFMHECMDLYIRLHL